VGAKRGRRSAVPGLGAGADSGASGLADTECEVAAGGRGGGGQGVLGRRRGGNGRPRPRHGHRHVARAVAQGTRQAGAALLDAGRGRVRVLAHPVPRRRLQPAAQSLQGVPPRRRRRLDRSTGPRPCRRPGGRPRLPLCDRPGTGQRRGPGRSRGDARGAGAAFPHPRRGTRTRPRHGGGHHQPRTGAGTHTRGPRRPCQRIG
jgi:hypothetical protein